ncbi:CD3e molecule, epsilon associated protein [Osmerus eperlanus]|uniref:CD3e molecule, epsilon associated protein n=1 Tax=Osmerus eperlanus TaxID=29151 RepID=UPI002E14BD88
MSKDISPQRQDETTQEDSPSKRKKIDTTYKCPADFVSFSHKPCSSTLIDSVSDKNTELWLIKAPNSFKPNGFDSLQVSLSGLQTLQSGSGQIYSILATPPGANELRLLTSHSRLPEKAVCGPAFSGFLNVCENYGDVSTNQAPKAIPATPAPCIPPGLRQRFQPFGSKTPTLSGVEPESSPVPSASSSNPAPYLPRQLVRQEQEEETRKKRKREKRSLAMEGGGEEEERAQVSVKTEPAALTPSQWEAPEGLEETDPREKRKKKKKKRDKDRGAGEEEAEGVQGLGVTVKQEVEVKDERLDAAYGDVEDSGKKRKKKKKNRQEDD